MSLNIACTAAEVPASTRPTGASVTWPRYANPTNIEKVPLQARRLPGSTYGALRSSAHRDPARTALLVLPDRRHWDAPVEDSTSFAAPPLFHVNALVVTTLGPIRGGRPVWAGPLGYRDPELIKSFRRIVERYEVNAMSAVPSVYATLTRIPDNLPAPAGESQRAAVASLLDRYALTWELT